MKLMARVLVSTGDHKGKTGTVLGFDNIKGLIIVGFDDGNKAKRLRNDLLEINDLESLEFEVGQKVFISELDKHGEIMYIDGDKYTVKLADKILSKILLNYEKDFILV